MLWFNMNSHMRLENVIKEEENEQLKQELELTQNKLSLVTSELDSLKHGADREQQLGRLMEFENEHIKSSLQDIQSNLA